MQREQSASNNVALRVLRIYSRPPSRIPSPVRPREAPPLKAGYPSAAQGDLRTTSGLQAEESRGSLSAFWLSGKIRSDRVRNHPRPVSDIHQPCDPSPLARRFRRVFRRISFHKDTVPSSLFHLKRAQGLFPYSRNFSSKGNSVNRIGPLSVTTTSCSSLTACSSPGFPL